LIDMHLRAFILAIAQPLVCVLLADEHRGVVFGIARVARRAISFVA
jgi:hypothetical protein